MNEIPFNNLLCEMIRAVKTIMVASFIFVSSWYMNTLNCLLGLRLCSEPLAYHGISWTPEQSLRMYMAIKEYQGFFFGYNIVPDFIPCFT